MSVVAQLSFLDEISASPPNEVDLVDSLLHAYRGNYRKVIAELLLDGDFLREQLATASKVMNCGTGRAWRPKYERT